MNKKLFVVFCMDKTDGLRHLVNCKGETEGRTIVYVNDEMSAHGIASLLSPDDEINHTITSRFKEENDMAILNLLGLGQRREMPEIEIRFIDEASQISVHLVTNFSMTICQDDSEPQVYLDDTLIFTYPDEIRVFGSFTECGVDKVFISRHIPHCGEVMLGSGLITFVDQVVIKDV